MIFFFAGIVLIVFFSWAFKASEKQNPRVDPRQQFQDLMKEKQENRDKIIEIIKDKYKVSSNASLFEIKEWSRYNIESDSDAYFWNSENRLNILTFRNYNLLFADINNLDYDRIIFEKIDLDDIQFHFNTGNFYTETQISGGGGGGSSITGAIAGGVLFGDAGAVIGSRRKLDPVTSKLLLRDTRESVIKYFINGDEEFIHLPYDEMKKLHTILPGKSIDEYYRKEKLISKKDAVENVGVKVRLVTLRDLKDANLVSDEEYEDKRKELLASL